MFIDSFHEKHAGKHEEPKLPKRSVHCLAAKSLCCQVVSEILDLRDECT